MKKACSIVPNDATLKYYFYFIQERMNIFWKMCEDNIPLTDDPILKEYKFTNVYRACDRVSQFLMRNVIYKDLDEYSPEDVLLRILVFKVFNRIETWDYLCQLNDITVDSFNVAKLSKALTRRQQNYPIFSNAYMMTGSYSGYQNISTKHQVWLQMIDDEFIKGNGLKQVLNAKSMAEVYNQQRAYPLIGDFLAYQYTIDFNYSPYLNFDEDSFVKAGVGAVRGIKKCFASYGNDYEDAIYYIHDHFEQLQERYGYTEFRPLPGRNPKLVDLQNCFCETDKYLRAKMPELKVGNVRIKQRYKPSLEGIDYYFPDKWGRTMTLKEITIEVTQQCPNRCIYCSSLSDMEKNEQLDFDVIKQVVDDAISLGAKSVSLSGGEPFMREDIAEIVTYLHGKGLEVRLYSSGISNIANRYTAIPTVLLETIKGKIDALIFNYEAIDADLYATIMRNEAANLTLLDETINRAVLLGIPVEAHLVPMHCNYRQIPNVLSKLYAMGVKNVSLLRLVPQGRVPENKALVAGAQGSRSKHVLLVFEAVELHTGGTRDADPAAIDEGNEEAEDDDAGIADAAL